MDELEITTTIPVSEPQAPTTDTQVTDVVEEVQTVADKILEDTQWLRQEVARLQAEQSSLKMMLDSTNSSQQQAEITSQLTSLREEIRNLKAQLSSVESPVSTQPISETPITVETVSEPPQNVVVDPLALGTRKRRRVI